MINHSPYSFSFNNPAVFGDPLGLEPDSTIVRPVPGKSNTYEPIHSKDNLPVVEVTPNPVSNKNIFNRFGSSERESFNNYKSHLWKIGEEYFSTGDIFKYARTNEDFAARILRQEYGEYYAIQFMKYDVGMAIHEFGHNYVTPVLLSLPFGAGGYTSKLALNGSAGLNATLLQSARLQTVNSIGLQSAGFSIRRIGGGVLINNRLRIQLHKHSLNPIKGRGYPGSIRATHLNINKFHLIFNPTKWDALSTWKYTPFRF